MSVEVTWGNNPNNLIFSEQVSDRTKWNSFMENVKRGWVLYVQIGKSSLPMIQDTSVLVNLDSWKRKGFFGIVENKYTFEGLFEGFKQNKDEIFLGEFDESFPCVNWGFNGSEWDQETDLKELEVK
ncbi:hypothetical protein HOM13_02025 [Candidatus Woesearchaeota archaeon]|jgi:hypothetical protein|nr:hypothetical protein [Candidatus Woesearchaeota archaeon]